MLQASLPPPTLEQKLCLGKPRKGAFSQVHEFLSPSLPLSSPSCGIWEGSHRPEHFVKVFILVKYIKVHFLNLFMTRAIRSSTLSTRPSFAHPRWPGGRSFEQASRSLQLGPGCYIDRALYPAQPPLAWQPPGAGGPLRYLAAAEPPCQGRRVGGLGRVLHLSPSTEPQKSAASLEFPGAWMD